MSNKPSNMDFNTEVYVTIQHISKQVDKLNEKFEDIITDKILTQAFQSTQKEKTENIEIRLNEEICNRDHAISNTAKTIRKEIEVNNDLQSNRMKVFIFSGLIGFAITISMPFIVEFIKNI